MPLERNRGQNRRKNRWAYLAAAGLAFGGGGERDSTPTSPTVVDSDNISKQKVDDEIDKEQQLAKLAVLKEQADQLKKQQEEDQMDFLNEFAASSAEDAKAELNKLRNGLVSFDTPGSPSIYQNVNYIYIYSVPRLGNFNIKEVFVEDENGMIKIDEPSTWEISFERRDNLGSSKKVADCKDLDEVIDYFTKVKDSLKDYKDNLDEQWMLMKEKLDNHIDNPNGGELELEEEVRDEHDELVKVGKDILEDIEKVLQLQ